MTTLQEIVDLADAMQLRGEERKAFIAEEMDKFRNLQAEEKAARLQAEENERQARLKIEEMKAQIEIEKIRAQAGAKTVGGAAEGTTGIYAGQVRPKLPRLPAFVDGKDDLDSWLLRFERFANTSGWPKENWCTSLSALLTGRALEIFCRLSESEAIDYDRVKEVLQKRYNLTEDGYRQKFRTCTAEDGENPSMFIVRLKTYLKRWMKLSETPQTYDGLRDLCIREQFLDSSPVDLSTYLRERKLPTLDEVAQSADLFLTARKRQLSDSVKPVTFNSQSKTTVAKKPEIPTCYICKRQGHRAGECRSNNVTKPNLGRGCFYCGEMTHVRRDCPRLKREGSKVSSPKRAGSAALRVVETRDAAPEESAGVTDTGCDVRAEVQDGLLQLASGKQVPAMVDCGACGGKKSAEDLNLPVVKGLVGDKTVNVLRDTSCEGVVVGRRLFEDSQVTGKCCLIVRTDNTVLLSEGEMTRVRRDCPRLKWEGSKVSLPKRAASAAVRVVETRDAAPEGSAGVTDTGCDVRAEVQDGMLQLESGKQVPAMVDCRAYGGKKSVEDLNLPVVKSLDGDKTVIILRDTSCEGVVVGRRLFEASQLTGKCRLIVRTDNTVLLAEKARIQVKTPYLSGDVESSRIPEAICDLVVGNVPGARNPDDPDMSVMVGAVTSRAQARQEVVRKPLRVPDAGKHAGVNRAELIPLQQQDYTIRKMGEAMTSTVSAGKTSSFEDYEPHANAQGADDPSAEVPSAEDLPESGASGPKESVTDLKFGDGLPTEQVREFRSLTSQYGGIFSDCSVDSFLGMREDRYFSKLDLTKGYHQIRVRPADVHKTAFVTMGQHYEYLRMPFGMVDSGMTVTRAVRKLLDGLDNVVDYIDDLLVHTRTWEEHVQTLKELFKQLKVANFVARPTKCVFGATQVNFWVIVWDRV